VHKAVTSSPQNVIVNYQPRRVCGTVTNIGWWRCRQTVNKQNVHAVQCEMQRRQICFNQSARPFCHCTKYRRKFLSKILNFVFNLVLIPYWTVPNQYPHLTDDGLLGSHILRNNLSSFTVQGTKRP